MSACEYGTHRWRNALTFALIPIPLRTRPRCLTFIFFTENESSSHRPHSFPHRGMTDQPGSARFQALLESAFQDYEEKAGVTLPDWDDSLAIRLQHCHSIDGITTLLQDKAQAFNDFKQRDRIFKSIRATVSILTPISAVASVADDAGLVRQRVPEGLSCIFDRFYRNYSHIRKRYILLSVSYWAYVPFLGSYVDILLTSRSIRRPMA